MSRKTSKKPARQELLRRFLRAGQMLSDETVLYHQAAAEQFGVSAADAKACSQLMSRGSMSAGELAETLGLTTGAVTSVIDRLERVGFVRRAPDPEDRRKVIVELVPESLQERSQVYQPMGEAMARLCEQYNDRELELLLGFMAGAAAILHEEAIRLRAQRPGRSERQSPGSSSF